MKQGLGAVVEAMNAMVAGAWKQGEGGGRYMVSAEGNAMVGAASALVGYMQCQELQPLSPLTLPADLSRPAAPLLLTAASVGCR